MNGASPEDTGFSVMDDTAVNSFHPVLDVATIGEMALQLPAKYYTHVQPYFKQIGNVTSALKSISTSLNSTFAIVDGEPIPPAMYGLMVTAETEFERPKERTLGLFVACREDPICLSGKTVAAHNAFEAERVWERPNGSMFRTMQATYASTGQRSTRRRLLFYQYYMIVDYRDVVVGLRDGSRMDMETLAANLRTALSSAEGTSGIFLNNFAYPKDDPIFDTPDERLLTIFIKLIGRMWGLEGNEMFDGFVRHIMYNQFDVYWPAKLVALGLHGPIWCRWPGATFVCVFVLSGRLTLKAAGLGSIPTLDVGDLLIVPAALYLTYADDSEEMPSTLTLFV